MSPIYIFELLNLPGYSVISLHTHYYMFELFGISFEVYIILTILGIPVFFIWRRIFRKSIKSDSKRKIALWLATILSTLIIYPGTILLLFVHDTSYPKRVFDKESWNTDREERYELSENIIESKMLIGKTKTQVRKVLGDDGNKNNSNTWTYVLGFKPGIGFPDNDILEIDFKDGKVFEVKQFEE